MRVHGMDDCALSTCQNYRYTNYLKESFDQASYGLLGVAHFGCSFALYKLLISRLASKRLAP